jgi:hypothetical protein
VPAIIPKSDKTTDLKLKVLKDAKDGKASNLLSDFLKSNENDDNKPQPSLLRDFKKSNQERGEQVPLSSDDLFTKFVQGVGQLGQIETPRDVKVLKSRQDDDDERNLVRDYRIKLMKGDTGDKGDKGEMGDKGLRGDPAVRGEKGLFKFCLFVFLIQYEVL